MLPMKCATLVIGSLLWEDGRREAWRQDRLRIPDSQIVLAPIRYGRRSSTRADTFTMVLDPAEPTGRAVLVPCAREVETIEDLIAEAEALWRAERNKTAGSGICAEWGSVGALFCGDLGDARVVHGWSQYFRSAATPVAPIDQLGTLGIPWPAAENGSVDMEAATVCAIARQFGFAATALMVVWDQLGAGRSFLAPLDAAALARLDQANAAVFEVVLEITLTAREHA